MQTSNPFEAPTSPVVSPRELGLAHGVWRKQQSLVFTQNATLPRACVKCNAPVQETLRRTLYWHPPLVYLTLLLSLIVYIIIALVTRKVAVVEVPLCPEHLAKRRNGVVIAVVTVVGSLALLIGSLATRSPGLALISGLAFLVGLVLAVVLPRTLVPTRIDHTHVEARGACEAYLAALPPWRG